MKEDKYSQSAAAFLEEPEKPINLKYYFFVFIKNLYVVLTFFIITITLASIYVAKIPDTYSSTVQLMIEKPNAGQQVTTATFQNPEGETYGLEYYNTQLEIMRSAAVLRQVVSELKLTDYFGIQNEEIAIARLRGMLKAERVAQSRLINIYVSGLDPQLVASVANATARAYVRKNFEDVLYYSKEILGWLPDSKNNQEMITIEDPFGAVKQVSREELIDSLPTVQTDPAIRSLREKKTFLESDLQALLKQYREKHPLVVKARANLKFLDESIVSEKKRVIESLKTQAEGQHSTGHARIIEEAVVPKSPVGSKRLPIVIMLGIAELIISFLIIVLLDYFDDTIRSLEDLERKGVILPFLGPIPYMKGKVSNSQESHKMFAGYYHKDSQIAEAFRYLRVAINFSASPESLRTLVFTSCLPHEGKSFISHNIAISFAVDGNRTLLVDGDLRRPVVHKIFRMDNASGLSNFLTSNVPLDSVLKESSVENLTIVTSGPVSPNPGEILGSERMRQFLKEVRERFDRVIIDCPPLTGIGDGYVVGSQMGQVILVIAAGKTPVDLIKHTQKQLEKAGTKIIGIILSMVDMEKERYGGYTKHYYHTYTRYYNPNQAPEPPK